jgi:hypothetical protein
MAKKIATEMAIKDCDINRLGVSATSQYTLFAIKDKDYYTVFIINAEFIEDNQGLRLNQHPSSPPHLIKPSINLASINCVV